MNLFEGRRGNSITHRSSWDFGCDPDRNLRPDSQMEQRQLAAEDNEQKVAASALLETGPGRLFSSQFPHPVDSVPFNFGKYKGLTPVAVAFTDPGYIVWCAAKGIATGSEQLVAHCQQVVERAGPAQPRGHLKYGRYR